MSIAKITGPGLVTMGLAVGLLWGCFIGEQVLVQRAAREQVRVLRELQGLRQRYRAEPVFTPVPQGPHRRHPAAG